MRTVDLHVDGRNVMHMRTLRGEVIPTAPGGVAWLDDPKSFRIRATSGVVALDGDAIAALLNEIAFNVDGQVIACGLVRKVGRPELLLARGLNEE